MSNRLATFTSLPRKINGEINFIYHASGELGRYTFKENEQ